MQNTFIDFRAVKAAVTMRMLLDHYGVSWLRKRGEELRGKCPIHKGEGTDTFHAHLVKNAFQCFSCKARGNVLDFVAAMEQCTVRDAAVKLTEWFSVTDEKPAKKATDRTAQKAAERGEEGNVENKPLTFELKGIDPAHPYLAERSITPETARAFGIGFFPGRGSMTGRVVIPIHNERGELVAYAGRAIDNSEPKYKLPIGFQKSLELYNLHRAMAKSPAGEGSSVVVVEGFFGAIAVHQAGFACVALMGSSLSQHQHELLCRHFKTVVLMLDGDEAGGAASKEMANSLIYSHFVKAVSLASGVQPDQLSPEELKAALS